MRGVPGPGTTIRIVDPETCVARALGAVGEVWVRSASAAYGYWKRPEQSARVFRAKIAGEQNTDYLRTGDFGFVECGELHIVGRLKDVIVIGGVNQHPEDIEATVSASGAVTAPCRCAAFGKEIAGTEEVVVVIEVNDTEADAKPLFAAVRQAVASALEIHVHSIALVRRGFLPLTSSGKVRRSAVRDLWLSGSLNLIACDRLPIPSMGDVASTSPGGDVKGRVRQLLIQQLGYDDADELVSEPLIRLGLNSLKAAELQYALKAEFAATVLMERLLGGATMADIAEDVGDQASGALPVHTSDSAPAAPESEPFEASLFQQRLWTLHRMAPAGALTIARAMYFGGNLDTARLQTAFAALVQRQPALRTAFSKANGRLLVNPSADVSAAIGIADMTDLPPSLGLRTVEEIKRQFAARSLAPERAPLWAACLVRLSSAEAVLVWCASHLIVDALSFDLLERDLAALYRSRKLAGALRVGYGTFAQRQLAEVPSERITSQVRHWVEVLRDVPALKWPEVAQPRSGVIRRTLTRGPQQRAALEAFCREHSVTMFTALLAALEVVVGRYAQQSDFAVSFPINHRPEEFRDLAGCFANRLCRRSRLDGGNTFSDHLRAVQQSILDALDNGDAPFALIKNAFDSERCDIAPDPLSQVLFQLHERSLITAGEGLAVEVEELPPPQLLFDIFGVATVSDGIAVTFLFHGGKFDEESSDWFLAAYSTLLEDLNTALSQPVFGIEVPRVRRPAPVAERLEIDITSNFVADGIRESLEYWTSTLSLDSEIRFVHFDQVMQYLLDPSILTADRRGISVILIQAQRWLTPHESTENGTALARFTEFALALNAASRRASGLQFIVLFCPLSPEFVGRSELEDAEAHAAGIVQGDSGVDVTVSAAFRQLYQPSPTWFDPYTDALAGIPYTRLGFASVATMVARRMGAILRRPRKVIVVDCDNTLWSGSVGEDGALGVVVDANRAALQRFLIDQVTNGRLLCICSKNSERDILQVLDRHPGTLLEREHLTAWRINWEPKPRNLDSLAEEIGLGPDSFIFIDDNPLECAAVRDHCPDVVTVQLPSDPGEIEGCLRSVWEFDFARVTAEDKKRIVFYRENKARTQAERAAPRLEDFLAGLQLEVTVRPIEAGDLIRVAELMVRTTQFNLNGVRLAEGELRAKAEEPSNFVLVTRARDRFGDYGIVGLLVCSIGQVLTIESMALSCRALGKRIEHRQVMIAAEAGLSAGIQMLEFAFTETERNAPVGRFLEELGANRDDAYWRISAPLALKVCRAALAPFGSWTTSELKDVAVEAVLEQQG